MRRRRALGVQVTTGATPRPDEKGAGVQTGTGAGRVLRLARRLTATPWHMMTEEATVLSSKIMTGPRRGGMRIIMHRSNASQTGGGAGGTTCMSIRRLVLGLRQDIRVAMSTRGGTMDARQTGTGITKAHVLTTEVLMHASMLVAEVTTGESTRTRDGRALMRMPLMLIARNTPHIRTKTTTPGRAEVMHVRQTSTGIAGQPPLLAKRVALT